MLPSGGHVTRFEFRRAKRRRRVNLLRRRPCPARGPASRWARCPLRRTPSITPLLPETLDALKGFAPLPADVAVHLNAGYDYRPCRAALEERGLDGQIAARGTPAPIQVGKRWPVERTNSWLNDFGRLRRCTERRRDCVDAYLALAAAIVTVRALCRAAWLLYRWDSRPRSRRIR